MIGINSNTMASFAQTNLSASQNALKGNMMQLSTGLRINSASDDAAGMQVTNRMTTQLNGLEQAQRNANDAISMAQTAEGAMNEMTDIMNRMRDLTMQANNDNYNVDDVAAMQKEMTQLTTEMGEIVDRTDFAGVDLLKGADGSSSGTTAATFTFQVGSDSGDEISITVTDMQTVHNALTASGMSLTTGSGSSLAVATPSAMQGIITALDEQLKAVDGARSDLGANINRIESKIDNLANVQQNMSVSKSRMLDADFAQQTTEMTSNQMLMQAGTSVMAQAKSMPQYAVQLMG